jgi:TonB family protein
MRTVALAAAGMMAAAPLATHADPAPHAAPAPAHAAVAAPATAPDPVLAFYPAGARAAGVEGQATLRCARNEHLALVNCALVSETPAGQGFGAAALAMAAQSKDNPKVDLPALKTEASADTVIKFQLHPPDITPDITLMAHTISAPKIVAKPTPAQIQAAYPVRALSDQVEGGAIIACTVTERGDLNACHVGREEPAGYGFGQAAVDLAPDFKMSPARIDGDPVGGAPVNIAVGFTAADPSAPLSLETKPPSH